MALLFADGFDHYGTDVENLLKGAYISKPNPAIVTTDLAISTDSARTGTRSLRFKEVNANDTFLTKAVVSNDTLFGAGFGIYFTDFSTNKTFDVFLKGASNALLFRLVFRDGKIIVHTSDYNTPIGETAAVLPTNAWHHVEVQYRASTVIGSLTVRINGVQEFQISNINTGNTIPTSFQFYHLVFGGALATWATFVDDFVMYNGAGVFNNTWLGVVRVNTVFPDANSTPQDWSTVGAASAVLAINETTPNEATYINAANVGNNSKFSLQNLPAEISAIAGIYVPTFAKSDQAGLSQMRVRLDSGAKTETSALLNLLPSFTYQDNIFQNNWTRAEFDAATINFEKVG